MPSRRENYSRNLSRTLQKVCSDETMAVSKAKKKEVLDDLKKILKDSLSVVFVNFHGLSANDSNTIRKALSQAKVGYMVSKKTLAKKALEDAKVTGDMPELTGELALVYGDDQIAPAREVYQFQKKLDKKISILGGIFEGIFTSKEKMLRIAEIPSRKTLEAQFVNLINSPIQGFVMALSEIAKKKV